LILTLLRRLELGGALLALELPVEVVLVQLVLFGDGLFEPLVGASKVLGFLDEVAGSRLHHPHHQLVVVLRVPEHLGDHAALVGGSLGPLEGELQGVVLDGEGEVEVELVVLAAVGCQYVLLGPAVDEVALCVVLGGFPGREGDGV